MALDFTSIPILDFSQTKSPATKPIFLAELQNALVKVGFFYIKNHAIPEDIQTELIRSSVQFFDLPTEKKLEVDMVNSRHYFGYVRVGNEKSSGKIDYRETFTLGMDNPAPGPNDPLYCNMLGPGQWPDESSIPGFGQAVRNYISAVHHLADEFKVLVAEALDLEPTALLSFFNDRPGDRFKLIKYPQPSSISSQGGEDEGQDAFSGIGPHKDGTFLTFLLQGTPHSGLEIQNKRGEWIPALPIPGTLVVNIGRMFEALTGGICTATTHRVNLREENFMDGAGNLLGPRYSFPMFLPFRLDLAESEMPLKIPDHIADYVRGEKVESDARGMSQAVYNVRVGDGVFMGSAIKHPRVAHRWYPEILARSQAASV